MHAPDHVQADLRHNHTGVRNGKEHEAMQNRQGHLIEAEKKSRTCPSSPCGGSRAGTAAGCPCGTWWCAEEAPGHRELHQQGNPSRSCNHITCARSKHGTNAHHTLITYAQQKTDMRGQSDHMGPSQTCFGRWKAGQLTTTRASVCVLGVGGTNMEG
jgi:hypothetical protein